MSQIPNEKSRLEAALGVSAIRSDAPNSSAGSQATAAANTAAPTPAAKVRKPRTTARMPRETKIGLAIIGGLVCVFGWVLYTRLTRPADLDAEQYVAQNSTETALPQPLPSPTGPTILAGNAQSSLAPPSGGYAPPARTMPTGGDPFFNRNPSGASPASFAAPVTNDPTPAATPAYGMNDRTAEPRPSFLPPREAAQPMTTPAATPGYSLDGAAPPSTNPLPAYQGGTNSSAIVVHEESPAATNPATATAQPANAFDRFSKAGADAMSAGTTLQNQISAAGSDLSKQAEQAGDRFRDAGGEMKAQANDLFDQSRTAATQQLQNVQSDVRNTANGMLDDASARLRGAADAGMSKLGETTNSAFASGADTINTALAPLNDTANRGATTYSNGGSLPQSNNTGFVPAAAGGSPVPAANVGYSTNGASNIAATSPTYDNAPRTLEPTTAQPMQALNGGGLASDPGVAQPIRIPSEATQPYSNGSYSATTGNEPASTSAAPLRFTQPNIPASSPSAMISPQPSNAIGTRTSFDSPSAGMTAGATPVQSRVQQYAIQAQDSYYSIAERYYGNGMYNKALFEYNRRHNPNADRLNVGASMLIPDAATLQADYPDLIPVIGQGTAPSFQR